MSDLIIPEISLQPLRVVETHEGGFGRVLIVEAVNGRRYALKTLKWAGGNATRESFAEEIKALAAAADHENIAEILGVYWSRGDPFLAMPFYPRTVHQVLTQSGRLSPSDVNQVVLDVALGLHYLHEDVGILHLDLKPANVLLTDSGRAAIADFGISRMLPEPSPCGERADLFLSGVTGTLAYMSPEQLLHQKVGPASDVFSLGVVAYEMLTGRHPFLAADLDATVRRILTAHVKFTRFEAIKWPKVLTNTITACLRKTPDLRPSAEDLVQALSGGSIPSPSQPTTDLVRRINKASSLMAIGRHSEAEEILQQCLTDAPFDVTPLVNLAEVRFAAGNVEGAVEMAKRAQVIAGWVPAKQGTVSTLLTNIANYYLSVDPAEAIRHARNAVELNPDDWQALGNLAEGCRILGEARHNYDLLHEGMVAVDRALELNGGDRKLKISKGGLALALGDNKTAWDIAVPLVNAEGADDVPLRVLLIRILIRNGQIDEAERWIQPMRQHEPLHSIVSSLDREIEVTVAS